MKARSAIPKVLDEKLRLFQRGEVATTRHLQVNPEPITGNPVLPPELVKAHLNVDDKFIANLPKYEPLVR
jgi:hypothetical protein